MTLIGGTIVERVEVNIVAKIAVSQVHSATPTDAATQSPASAHNIELIETSTLCCVRQCVCSKFGCLDRLE